MGSKRQPAPPPPPNPYDIANAEAQYNRIDQVTPFGSLTFEGPQRNMARLELSPELQNLFSGQVATDTGLSNLAQQALPGIGELVNQPISTGNFPSLNAPQLQGLNLSGVPSLPQDYGQFRNNAERAFFDRSSGLLNEQFGREEERLRQTLANQGLQIGGEAYGTELGEFNRRRGETFSNLARDATIFGGQEASRSLGDALSLRGQGFQEALTGTDFANQLAQQGLANNAGIRGQLLQEQQALRGGQFNELASLLGLQQTATPGLQNFFAPSQVGVGDAFALNQAAQQNAFNQRSATARHAKGEFGDLLQTAIGMPRGGKGG